MEIAYFHLNAVCSLPSDLQFSLKLSPGHTFFIVKQLTVCTKQGKEMERKCSRLSYTCSVFTSLSSWRMLCQKLEFFFIKLGVTAQCGSTHATSHSNCCSMKSTLYLLSCDPNMPELKPIDTRFTGVIQQYDCEL